MRSPLPSPTPTQSTIRFITDGSTNCNNALIEESIKLGNKEIDTISDGDKETKSYKEIRKLFCIETSQSEDIH